MPSPVSVTVSSTDLPAGAAAQANRAAGGGVPQRVGDQVRQCLVQAVGVDQHDAGARVGARLLGWRDQHAHARLGGRCACPVRGRGDQVGGVDGLQPQVEQPLLGA